MTFKYITYKDEEGIGRLTLNKPLLNVLDIAMMREIGTVLEGLLGDSAIKVLVIDAVEGSKVLSAGVDIEEHSAEMVDEMISVFHRIFHHFETLEVPTVAVVNGAALGGGCELVLHCDIVIASEKSSFGQPEIQVGVFPPVAAVTLPEIVGPKKAFELLITGDIIPAVEAARLGLINKVVPPEELDEVVEELVGKLTNLSGAALRMTKRAMRIAKYQGGDFAEKLDAVEQLYLGPLMDTEDAHEGLTAFMEKRPPKWKNR
jgi:cyclohexa-1,5-dienecarbonyl-CoA hydratase